jgi:hypothetical protein
LKEPIENYRKELFHVEYFGRIRPFPCSRALLQKMRTPGLRVAVASSASREDLGKSKRSRE